MTLVPAPYQGRPLAELVADLARGDPAKIVARWQRDARPTPAPVRAAALPPVVEWSTTWLAPPGGDAWLPPGHPDVAVPDVTLEHLLGGGSQGLVYAGRVRSTGLVVAVKVLHHDYVRGGSRAVREAEILARVRHRNVLRVFRVEQVGAFWVLVMEFLQGKDLAGTRLVADQARPCLAQLADAVRALGEGHIVHRDIKPANIVLRQGDSSPVLIDFGLALDLTAASAEDRAQVCGTPLFMTPDAFTGAAPEPSWDAYALGLTAVHLAGGDPIPYAGTTWRTLVDAKVSGDFDRAVERCLGRLTDGPLRSWVAGLIGRDPAARLAALPEARRWLPAR